MNFAERMLPTSEQYRFSEEGYYVWCGSMLQHNGSCYLLYSRWKKELGFQAWVTDSEICLAKSDSPLGEFRYVKTVLPCVYDSMGNRTVFHNPTVMVWKGRYYLYFMSNHGCGDWWEHRNNQRIYAAYAEDPQGEWTMVKEPVIDVSDEGIDSLMTSNPSVLVKQDGRILMIYKAVSKYGELPRGGKVLCGAAEAAHPLGPFVKVGKPIMENPQNPWSVEDPFIWAEHGRYWALVKDFHGYFTQTDRRAVALFVSDDGYEWKPSAFPLAFRTTLDFGTHTEEVTYLERPQLYFENGHPTVLLCACMEQDETEPTCNIRIPLKQDGI